MTRLARIQPIRQLVPLDIVSPGSRGLNTVQAGQLMDSSFAATALNAVIDTSGRLAARQGIVNQTLTPLTNIVITNELEATGNGTTVAFSGTFLHSPVIPSTVTITAGAVVATDDGAGHLTGAGVVTGTINYGTGTFTITYSVAPGPGVQIRATYTYTPSIKEIFEYNPGDGTYQIIVSWDGGAANDISAPQTHSIAGTASLANGTWFFQNFNNKMVAFQNGQKPAVYTKAGNQLNTIVESQGTWPVSSGVGASAFGRIWSVSQSDGQTITYCGLLDETDVGSPSAGIINMHSIWSDGTDQITAIFGFNSALVVCGNKHIIMFTDGRGSMLGIDPTQAYVFDVLSGTGCTSQWTAKPMGEADYIFVSANGVQSLGRLTADRNNPTFNLGKFVRDSFLAQISSEVPNTLQATYNPLTGFYITSAPTAGTIWCLDQRRRYQDETGNVCSPVTTWSMRATAMMTSHANLTYIARTAGTVGLYTGNTDETLPYIFSWLSPWMSFSQQAGEALSVKLKLLKRYKAIVFTGGNAVLGLSWATDFANNLNQVSFSLANLGSNSQYGLGQYGLAQYGGGAASAFVNYDARARGQYYQFGVTISVTTVFALQQVQAAVKLGRVA